MWWWWISSVNCAKLLCPYAISYVYYIEYTGVCAHIYSYFYSLFLIAYHVHGTLSCPMQHCKSKQQSHSILHMIYCTQLCCSYVQLIDCYSLLIVSSILAFACTDVTLGIVFELFLHQGTCVAIFVLRMQISVRPTRG